MSSRNRLTSGCWKADDETEAVSPSRKQDLAGSHIKGTPHHGHNGHRVLEQLYDHPIVSVSQVQNWVGTTYPAANNLVTRMVDCGILREVTGQARNRRFMYQSYIELFHDSESDVAV